MNSLIIKQQKIYNNIIKNVSIENVYFLKLAEQQIICNNIIRIVPIKKKIKIVREKNRRILNQLLAKEECKYYDLLYNNLKVNCNELDELKNNLKQYQLYKYNQ